MYSIQRALRHLLPTRRYASTLTRAGQPMYYYLDTNVLVLEKNGHYARHGALKDWLYRNTGHFYVTEQVRDEFKDALPSYAQYTFSHLPEDGRNAAFQQIVTGLKLTEDEIQEFSPDIHIVLEASYSRWRAVPLDGTSRILTRNLTFIRRCLDDPRKRKVFEKAMNDFGLDHLIRIDDLDSIEFEDTLTHE